MQKSFVNRLHLVLHVCVETFDVMFFLFTGVRTKSFGSRAIIHVSVEWFGISSSSFSQRKYSQSRLVLLRLTTTSGWGIQLISEFPTRWPSLIWHMIWHPKFFVFGTKQPLSPGAAVGSSPNLHTMKWNYSLQPTIGQQFCSLLHGFGSFKMGTAGWPLTLDYIVVRASAMVIASTSYLVCWCGSEREKKILSMLLDLYAHLTCSWTM